MESEKLLERSSQFFTYKAFKEFQDDLHMRNPPFTQLEIKCCGYGYFPRVKQSMKTNFRKYLNDAGQFCQDLTILKVIYNGFDVDDGSLIKLFQVIQSIFIRRKISVLWLQTTNLRKCREEDLIQMFALISRCGSENYCKEINIIMSDWEFQGGYIKYKRLVQIFSYFLEKQIRDGLHFKKFRLEISSWYMKQKEAYNFLKESLGIPFLRQHLLKLKSDKEEDRKEEQVVQTQELPHTIEEYLDFYLQNMDEKFLKPAYPFKKNPERYNKQDQTFHKERQQLMIQKMSFAEEVVGKHYKKYPNEYITQLKVADFHKNMLNFLGGLLLRLPEVQEYHIDMRNWNSMFGMASLKKTLDTKKNAKQESSSIRNSLGMDKAMSRISMTEMDKAPAAGLKTIYTM